MKAVSGSELQKTSKFIAAKKALKDECRKVAEIAADLAVGEAMTIQKKSGFNHGDLNKGNRNSIISFCRNFGGSHSNGFDVL